MYMAQRILATPDRTPRERRDMAEIRDTRPGGRVDFQGDCQTCYFSDGSALMMTFDENFCPTEFLAIAPPGYDDAMAHALACLDSCPGWDHETLSHNLESNFPELELDDCDSIAEAVLAAGGRSGG